MTRTVVQPAIAVMALRRITFTQAARATGYNAEYISRVLRGFYPLTSEFCSRLTAYLGEPEDRLFLVEVMPRHDGAPAVRTGAPMNHQVLTSIAEPTDTDQMLGIVVS